MEGCCRRAFSLFLELSPLLRVSPPRKFLGGALNVPNSERLFILGLLHNLGELVVQQFMPTKVENCEKVSSQELPWNKQRSVFNFTYGECSGELLKLWQLPYSLIEPIREQDHDNFEFSSMESKLLYVSKRIMALNHQCSHQSFSDLLAEDKLEGLNIDHEMINSANSFCDMERLGILSVLKPSAAMIY